MNARLAGAAAALLLASCGTAGGSEDTVLTVFAAASLTEAFTEIGAAFEAEHDGVAVEFAFAASSTLATQIDQGAPADVFAPADERYMDAAAEAGRAVAPAAFARNQLVIAVPEGNPRGVEGLADLAGLAVAVCAEEVPCGRAAQAAFAASDASVTPATYQEDAKATLAKLTLGEVDAALVYRTDAVAAGTAAVEFPESAAAVNTYPIAALAEARDAGLARAFVDFVLADRAQAVLEAAGFQRP